MQQDNYAKIVIKVLKKTRKDKKITQSDLAKMMNVSRDTIARIENGTQRLTVIQMFGYASAVSDNPVALLEEINNEFYLLNSNMIPPNYYVEKNKDSYVVTAELEWDTNTDLDTVEYLNLSEPINELKLNAVDVYGSKMRRFIKNHRLFWHWVSENRLNNLSLNSVVEGVLNQGRSEEIRQLINIIGLENTAAVFRKQITSARHGYSKKTKHYFETYFNRHVPQHS